MLGGFWESAAIAVTVAAFVTDLVGQAVEAAVQVGALPGRQAAAAVVGLETQQAVEFAAQTYGFAAAQLALRTPWSMRRSRLA